MEMKSFLVLLVLKLSFADLNFARVTYSDWDELQSTTMKFEQRSRSDPCIKETLLNLENRCESLKEEGRDRLALQLANCQLQKSNKKMFPCPTTVDFKHCTSQLTGDAWSSYILFASNIDHYCKYHSLILTQEEFDRVARTLLGSVDQASRKTEQIHELLTDTYDFYTTLNGELHDGFSKIKDVLNGHSDEILAGLRQLKEKGGVLRILTNLFESSLLSKESLIFYFVAWFVAFILEFFSIRWKKYLILNAIIEVLVQFLLDDFYISSRIYLFRAQRITLLLLSIIIWSKSQKMGSIVRPCVQGQNPVVLDEDIRTAIKQSIFKKLKETLKKVVEANHNNASAIEIIDMAEENKKMFLSLAASKRETPI